MGLGRHCGHPASSVTHTHTDAAPDTAAYPYSNPHAKTDSATYPNPNSAPYPAADANATANA